MVKFNRRGKAAFRTVLLVGDHTLTWRGDKKQKGALGDLLDLRTLKHVQVMPSKNDAELCAGQIPFQPCLAHSG